MRARERVRYWLRLTLSCLSRTQSTGAPAEAAPTPAMGECVWRVGREREEGREKESERGEGRKRGEEEEREE